MEVVRIEIGRPVTRQGPGGGLKRIRRVKIGSLVLFGLRDRGGMIGAVQIFGGMCGSARYRGLRSVRAVTRRSFPQQLSNRAPQRVG